MTKDKARKRAARELARRRGIPYVRALREVTEQRAEGDGEQPEGTRRPRPPT